MSIFIGVLITALGAVLILKTEWFLNNFGRIGWFEEKLGSEGGSRFGYKLLGIIGLFVGIVVMTGSGNELITWILSPLIQSGQPQ